MKVKTTLMAALVASLLAASTVGVAAQEEPSGASYFTVVFGPPSNFDEGEPGDSGDGWEATIGTSFQDVPTDAGDPRASGIFSTQRNATLFPGPDGIIEINRSTSRLVNEQGAWVGTGTLTLRAENGPPSQVSAWRSLVGEGAYEGLTLELHGEEPGPNGEVWWGVIYPTEATPPMPELLPAN